MDIILNALTNLFIILIEIVIPVLIIFSVMAFADKVTILQPYISLYKQKLAKRIIQYFDDWLEHEPYETFESKLEELTKKSYEQGVSTYYSNVVLELKDLLKADGCYDENGLFEVQKICFETLDAALLASNSVQTYDFSSLDLASGSLIAYQEAMYKELQSVIKQNLKTKQELEKANRSFNILWDRYAYVIGHYDIRKPGLFKSTLPKTVSEFDKILDKELITQSLFQHPAE